MIRIIGILLITIISTAYTPDPVTKDRGGLASVFDSKRKRADRCFNNLEYKSAIKLYNKLVKKGKADDGVKLRLAESYLKVNDPINAEKWYSEVIHSGQITPQHQIEYAQTLLSNGKYEEARQVINSYEFADSDYRSTAILNDLETILADNNAKTEINDQINPLSTSELSTDSEFDELEDIEDLSTINVSIIDENNNALDNANLKLLVNGQESENLLSNEDGEVLIQVPAYQEYTLAASKKGFEDGVITIPAETLGQEEDLLMVVNSVSADYDLPDEQIPTTELELVPVSDKAWEDDVINLPVDSGQTAEEMLTTKPDHLTITEGARKESLLDNNEQPELPNVAMKELSSNVDQLIDAKVLDAGTSEVLKDAAIKLFVDNPNEFLEYELNEGVLTFEALPGEDYIIVASHEDYQDEFIKLSGDELLAGEEETIDLELTKNDKLLSDIGQKGGPSTKFKATVRDHETDELLKDAKVNFFVDGKAIDSEYSKDNGNTVFKSPQGKDYMMLVSRKGYQDLIYHLPGDPEENMEVDLALLKAEDFELTSTYPQLVVKDHAYDEFSGKDLDDVTFKVFVNGDLIENTNDLSTIEVDPHKRYQVLASKEGYHESLVTIDPSTLNEGKPINLPFSMKQEKISEVTGAPVYDELIGEEIQITANIVDISDDQPLSEALVLVFADGMIQDKVTTWNSGIVTINTVTGSNYQLVINRDGYSDQIVNLGEINAESADGVEIAMIPQDVQKFRQSGVDISQANMLVLSGPAGAEQLYLSTGQDLFQYTIENGNHYLVNDNQTILLKGRSPSSGSRVLAKQDSDQFNLGSGDQFLYDQLSADEKEMIDHIVEHLQQGSELEENPELVIYYNNLPEEYRGLVDKMVVNSSNTQFISKETDIVSSERFSKVLADNQISLTGTFNVNNIYYDFDKSNIREDAALELDKLVLILKGNKNIKIQMFSHTDSRGSNSYNSNLSNRRGTAAVDYLVEHGIESSRISTEGRGESQLINSCGDAVKCNELAHQLNRRTEFILSA